MLSVDYVQNTGGHTLFMKNGKEGKVAILIFYVDDIVITGSDEDEIHNLKTHLTTAVSIQTLGLLTYFLGFKVAYSKSEISLTQYKYILDFFK